MRISDWSSDVCSSDLLRMCILRHCDMHGTMLPEADLTEALLADCNLSAAKLDQACLARAQLERCNLYDAQLTGADFSSPRLSKCIVDRPEERRGGKECVSTSRSRGSQYK